ncbi:MAG: hypothetical protein LBP51_07315 [Deferribacteraceae bacterium]|nr:hypothetical protein [Deferribacteraceae bacterium]
MGFIIALIEWLLSLILKVLVIGVLVSIPLIILAALLFRAKVLPAIRSFLNRDKAAAYQDELIIDVVPTAPLQEHGFTPEERAKITSEAILEAMSNKNLDETPRDSLIRLTEIARITSNKREQPELAAIRRITLDLFSVFKSDPNHLRYTYTHLAQCISGLNELANRSFAAVTGILYAVEAIKKYVAELSTLAELSISTKSETLSLCIDGFIERVEKLRWLFLIYPAESVKHGRLVNDMLSSLTDKLQIHAKMREYSVTNSENNSKHLIDKTEVAVNEMNTALDMVLKNILERDLLKADSELDALRQDLRLRGLY